VIRGRGGNDHITVERGDRVRGDRGDDVLQARTLFAGRLRCGAGRDKVLLTPAYRRGAIVRGPLLDADCERLELAHSNLTFDPQPTRAAGGALAFRMFVFR
jgi:hypothetical protein